MEEQDSNMSYSLNKEVKSTAGAALRKLFRFMKEERRSLFIAFLLCW